MKIKNYLLFGLILSLATPVLASAVFEQEVPQKKNAILYSTNQSVDSEYSAGLTQLSIEDLEQELANNPTDYALSVNLFNSYLDAKEYEKSFNEILFLYNLSVSGELDVDSEEYLQNLYDKKRRIARYEKNKKEFYPNLAILALISGKQKEAEIIINDVIELGEETPILNEAIYLVAKNSENQNWGLEKCNSIIKLYPENTSTRKLKAEFLKEAGKNRQVIKEYSNIVKIDNSDNATKYELYKLLEAKNYSERKIANKIYPAIFSPKEEGLVDLTNLLVENNKIQEAETYVNMLLKKSPDNAQGNMLLSEIYRLQGKTLESTEKLKQVKDKVDTKEEVKNYNQQLAKLSEDPIKDATNLIKEGLFEQANDVLKTADQDNLKVLLLTSRANQQLNNMQAAYEALNKAMLLYPKEDVQLYLSFANLYLNERDFETAEKYVEEAKAIFGEDKKIDVFVKKLNKKKAESYLNKIVEPFEAQNYDEALRLADEALQLNKDVPLLYFYKALIQIAQNNYADSTANLYKCIELSPNNYLAYFYLATAFDNLAEKENALINYKKFLEVLPPDAYGEAEKSDYAKARIEKLQE